MSHQWVMFTAVIVVRVLYAATLSSMCKKTNLKMMLVSGISSSFGFDLEFIPLLQL